MKTIGAFLALVGSANAVGFLGNSCYNHCNLSNRDQPVPIPAYSAGAALPSGAANLAWSNPYNAINQQAPSGSGIQGVRGVATVTQNVGNTVSQLFEGKISDDAQFIVVRTADGSLEWRWRGVQGRQLLQRPQGPPQDQGTDAPAEEPDMTMTTTTTSTTSTTSLPTTTSTTSLPTTTSTTFGQKSAPLVAWLNAQIATRGGSIQDGKWRPDTSGFVPNSYSTWNADTSWSKKSEAGDQQAQPGQVSSAPAGAAGIFSTGCSCDAACQTVYFDCCADFSRVCSVVQPPAGLQLTPPVAQTTRAPIALSTPRPTFITTQAPVLLPAVTQAPASVLLQPASAQVTQGIFTLNSVPVTVAPITLDTVSLLAPQQPSSLVAPVVTTTPVSDSVLLAPSSAGLLSTTPQTITSTSAVNTQRVNSFTLGTSGANRPSSGAGRVAGAGGRP